MNWFRRKGTTPAPANPEDAPPRPGTGAGASAGIGTGTGTGIGSGTGTRTGAGSGSGSGRGEGSGVGVVAGSGTGPGHGSGTGSGTGPGHGSGTGSGTGPGHGSGTGSGSHSPGLSRSSAPSLEGAAPGITALLEGVDAGGGHSVLDLGRATGAKLDLYSPVARRMRFVDLLETESRGEASWARAVEAIPAEPDHPYDLVLAWDILDRIPPELHGALVTRLAGVVGPKARLHLLVAASEASLPELFRFTPLGAAPGPAPGSAPGSAPRSAPGPARLRYDPTGLSRPSHPRLHPAEVESILEPFRVIRAFTLKVGFREIVAVRGA